MTPSDDEVLARLRLSLRAVADRTPISAGRSTTLAALAEHPPSRSLVTAFSAAAAVAAMVAVAAVVANAHSGGHGSAQPGAGGLAGPAAGLGSSAAPSAVASLAPTPPSSPTPVTSAIAGSVAPQQSPGGCVPENYYVIASSAQLVGLTYLLPTVPAGYTLYGAWGTIARNDCAGSQTWYVEYDKSADATTNISISVRPAAAEAHPEAATATTVQGHPAWLLNKDATYGFVVWQAGGLDFQVSGPMVGGTGDALVAVANALTAVSVDDPRIVAPTNCQVPAGSSCPSDPPATVSPTPNPTG